MTVYVYSSSQACHRSPGSEKVPLDQRSKVPLLIFGTAGMRCSGQPESHGNPEMGRFDLWNQWIVQISGIKLECHQYTFWVHALLCPNVKVATVSSQLMLYVLSMQISRAGCYRRRSRHFRGSEMVCWRQNLLYCNPLPPFPSFPSSFM